MPGGRVMYLQRLQEHVLWGDELNVMPGGHVMCLRRLQEHVFCADLIVLIKDLI